MTKCEDCGSAVYKQGCVNCNEENYIQEQEMFNCMPEIYETNPDYVI